MADAGTKSFTVDNWAPNFLDRLCCLYEEQELCDMELKTGDDKIIKVHSLVFKSSSEYVKAMAIPRSDGTSLVKLPPSIMHGHLEPIVRFLYTGAILFDSDNWTGIVRAASELKIEALMKLFEAICCSIPDDDDSQRLSMRVQKESGVSRQEYEINIEEELTVTEKKSSRHKKNADVKIAANSDVIDLQVDPENRQTTTLSYNLQPDFKFPTLRSKDKKPQMNVKLEDDLEESCPPLPEPREDQLGFIGYHFKNSKKGEPPEKRAKTEALKQGNKKLFDTEEHQKILEEVVKKYPRLTKNSSNLRLKFVQRATKREEIKIDQKKKDESKVAYLVLKTVQKQQKAAEEEEEDMDSNALQLAKVLAEDAMKTSKPDKRETKEVRLWTCRLCHLKSFNRQFQTPTGFRRHLSEQHQHKLTLVCEVCGGEGPKRFLVYSGYVVRHDLVRPTPTSDRLCTGPCAYVAFSEPMSNLNAVSHKCQKCKQHFSSAASLTSHMNLKHQPKLCYTCVECDLDFSKSSYLKAHLKTYHGKAGPILMKEVYKVDKDMTKVVRVYKPQKRWEDSSQMIESYECASTTTNPIQNNVLPLPAPQFYPVQENFTQLMEQAILYSDSQIGATGQENLILQSHPQVIFNSEDGGIDNNSVYIIVTDAAKTTEVTPKTGCLPIMQPQTDKNLEDPKKLVKCEYLDGYSEAVATARTAKTDTEETLTTQNNVVFMSLEDSERVNSDNNVLVSDRNLLQDGIFTVDEDRSIAPLLCQTVSIQTETDDIDSLTRTSHSNTPIDLPSSIS